MGVRAEDPADAPLSRLEDLLDVLRHRRPGVDHRETVSAADKIGIGARPGHDTGVGRDDARHVAIEALRLAGHELVVRVAVFLRVAPVDLEVGRIRAAEELRAFASLRPAGAVRLDFRRGERVLEAGARGGMLLEIAERLLRGEDELHLVLRPPPEPLAAPSPPLVPRPSPLLP